MRNWAWGQISDRTQCVKDFIEWFSCACNEPALDKLALLHEIKHSYKVDDLYISFAMELLESEDTTDEALRKLAAFYSDPKHDELLSTFEKKRFVLTGDFEMEGGKSTAEELIAQAGGRVTKAISSATDYVVQGSLGSDAYAYTNYGTKVKQAADAELSGQKLRALSEKTLLLSLSALGSDANEALAKKASRFDKIWETAEAVSADFEGLTAGQAEVFERIKAGENVYVTGLGGTGKSYILNKVISWAKAQDKNVVVCAPTGIAALNVGGVTIHRALGIRPSAALEPTRSVRLNSSMPLVACDLMIIDEISMCRMDLFDVVSRTLRSRNRSRKQEGLPPVQLMVVGDFCQLPPVLRREDAPFLKEFYGPNLDGAYAFMGREWQQWHFVKVELTQAIRQRDTKFVAALNAVRAGDTRGLRWIEAHAAKTAHKNAVHLLGKNSSVDEINNEKLEALPGRVRIYYAEKEGEVLASDKTAPDELRVKPGARVMATANVDPFMNGSMGTVVRYARDHVVVDFEGIGEVEVYPHLFEISKPELVDGHIKQSTIGTFEQLPLKLAWAITIHKSQGQTFDHALIYPECWDKGQLYTALSRLSDISGLCLAHPINDAWLKTSSEVIRFLEGDFEPIDWDAQKR